MASPKDLRRVNPAPITGNDATDQWMQEVADALNSQPVFSTFSAATPESLVTAIPGTYAANYASIGSVAWFKQTGSGTTGWVSVA